MALTLAALAGLPLVVPPSAADDAIASFTPVWTIGSGQWFSYLAPYAGGVDVVTNATLYHVQPAGADVLVEGAWNPGTRTSLGEPIYETDRDAFAVLKADGEVLPFETQGRFATFDAHGILVAIKVDRSVPRLVELNESRVSVSIADEIYSERPMLAMPDGRILFFYGGERIFDPATRNLTAPMWTNETTIGFDPAGGRFLVRAPYQDILHKAVDGAERVIAHSDVLLEDAVVASGRVWAIWRVGDMSTLGWAPTDAPVFERPVGSFSPAPAPDLVVTDIRETHLGIALMDERGELWPGERVRFEITVENRGLGSAGPTELNFARQWVGPIWSRSVPALAPGARHVATVDWHATGPVTEQHFHAWADALFSGREAEPDEDNNLRHHVGYAVVDGLQRACITGSAHVADATGVCGAPWIVPDVDS